MGWNGVALILQFQSYACPVRSQSDVQPLSGSDASMLDHVVGGFNERQFEGFATLHSYLTNAQIANPLCGGTDLSKFGSHLELHGERHGN
ncbi:hypothetical protein SAMN05660710_03284 [Paracoccus tibetensis]|uniref:Uncharacterized protein n=1 Tax=Paracoccus tibetensis TaxID=336292 RepID=A0A1G5JLU2_9RHOB|nr:hypothetical protein SAMN05660710_03284 [Paracoccus tibetensis]